MFYFKSIRQALEAWVAARGAQQQKAQPQKPQPEQQSQEMKKKMKKKMKKDKQEQSRQAGISDADVQAAMRLLKVRTQEHTPNQFTM